MFISFKEKIIVICCVTMMIMGLFFSHAHENTEKTQSIQEKASNIKPKKTSES
ncbi:MAG: hypothetical protein HN826_15400 [Methylococcales bacterium]|jgi:hypothetical protein|nr:hypothetical protein [Methylococcales bacterium]